MSSTRSSLYAPPHVRVSSSSNSADSSSAGSPVSSGPTLVAPEAIGTIRSSDRIVIGDIEGKCKLSHLIESQLSEILPSGCKLITLGDLLDIDIYAKLTPEGVPVRSGPHSLLFITNHKVIGRSFANLRRLLSLIISLRPRWFRNALNRIYKHRVRFDEDGIPINFNTTDLAARYLKNNLSNATIKSGKQFNLFWNSKYMKFTQLSDRSYYQYENVDDDSCVFIIGNKELVYLNIILNSSSITKIDANTINIHINYVFNNGSRNPNTPGTILEDDLQLTLSEVNLFYFYISLCRIAFCENDVLYIHNGNISTPNSGIHRIMINSSVFDPKKVICGHEKMICTLMQNGVQYYCIDNTRSSQSCRVRSTQNDHVFLLDTTDRVPLAGENTLMVVGSDGSVRMDNTATILSQPLYERIQNGDHSVQFHEGFNLSDVFIPNYRENNSSIFIINAEDTTE